MLRQRMHLYWHAYRAELKQAAKLVVLAVLGLSILISFLIIYSNRPNEIASPPRSAFDTDDAIIMKVVRICDGFIFAYLINNTDYFLEYGLPSIKAEQYSAGSWRILPFRRDAAFIAILLTIFPRQSKYITLNISQVNHTFSDRGLYRLRFEVRVTDRSFSPTRIHDIVAEFYYGDLPLCDSVCD